ncbi:hypothetical protein Q671_14295 [Halomonas sp. PBN3]|nr:hypothetical protein Q671_14295 [Halomonas sp. PBN3]
MLRYRRAFIAANLIELIKNVITMRFSFLLSIVSNIIKARFT